MEIAVIAAIAVIVATVAVAVATVAAGIARMGGLEMSMLTSR
jgi:hypothetical protein